MGWIDTLWPMVGAASLTLGLIYLLVWIRQPQQHGYLLFFVTAASVAGFSIFELRMMQAATPEEFAVTLRWAHVPVFIVFVAIVGFVRLYFDSGRMWLGYAACGLRAASLMLNFTTGANVNFEQVTAMLPVPIWGGESIYGPVGEPNPFAIVAQVSNLLLIGFVADASVALWRRGDANVRRRAVVVGGSMILCLLAASVLAVLLNSGLVRIPTALSVAFLGVVIAMAYELGWDVIAAARLTAQLRLSEEKLRESEQRLQLTAGAGGLGLWEWNVLADQVWMTREGRMLFGYRADEDLCLQRFLESVHPDDRAAVERSVSESLAEDGHDFEQEFRVALPDGRVRWMSSRGRIERDRTGAACRMRGVSQDITARRQAEERFRTLVEATSSAMLVLDAEGTVVLANARAETMYGYPREELIGRSIDALVPERMRTLHEGHRRGHARDLRPRAMGAGRDLCQPKGRQRAAGGGGSESDADLRGHVRPRVRGRRERPQAGRAGGQGAWWPALGYQ